MKTLMICFSQTGNTRKIAECIEEGIVDAGAQCELKALDDVDANSPAGYDLIGLSASHEVARTEFPGRHLHAVDGLHTERIQEPGKLL